MILQAVLSNKAHPEYGQVTVPFPIPDGEYDHTIGLLEGMGIGSPTAQDCRVDELDGPYPVLNRLVTQSVNVDELDHLAKRLDSFSKDEDEKFEAMASKLCLSDIKDFINLTFCCQRATVITDFSDLERIGKNHALTVSGDSLPVEVLEKMDHHDVALDLTRRGAGTVTPYGVVYDNGMKLEPLYDGRHFPAYLHGTPEMMLEIKSEADGETTGYLYQAYLGCFDKQAQKQEMGLTEKGRQMLRDAADPAKPHTYSWYVIEHLNTPELRVDHELPLEEAVRLYTELDCWDKRLGVTKDDIASVDLVISKDGREWVPEDWQKEDSFAQDPVVTGAVGLIQRALEEQAQGQGFTMGGMDL